MSVTAMPLRPVARTGIAILGVCLAIGVGGAVWAGVEGTDRAAIQMTRGTPEFLRWNGARSGVETLAGGTQIEVLEAGAGPSPSPDDIVEIGYTGKLSDGSVFDKNDKVPFPASGTIPGFSAGLAKMHVGGRYRVWIPPEQGYGAEGRPPIIPPDSLLVFDIALKTINNPEIVQQLRMMQQLQQMQGAARGGAPGEGVPPDGR